MAQSNVVTCDMPPLDGEEDGFRLSCVVPLDRHNGNTEMYVDAQSSTWNYLSKLIAQEYGKPWSAMTKCRRQSFRPSPQHRRSLPPPCQKKLRYRANRHQQRLMTMQHVQRGAIAVPIDLQGSHIEGVHEAAQKRGAKRTVGRV